MVRLDRPTLTAAAVRVLAKRTPYLEREMLGLSHIVGPGGVCVDVGSAVGLYTLALSQLVGPAGQVHSVEPLSFVHPMWTRLLRARDRENVTHHTIALGVEPGKGVMSVPIGKYGPVTGRSFLTKKANGLGSNSEFNDHIEVVVEVDTLDALSAKVGMRRLDFLKIDVEGAELQVLEGGTRTIEEFRPSVLMEIEARHTERYEQDPDDIAQWLVNRGYAIYVWQDGWRRTDSVSEQTRNYLFRARA